jgi:hypothetical protein
LANITGVTTTALLSTAGLSPDQYGLQVAIDAANKSVMLPLIRRYMIPEGSTLYIPKVGTRSATARTRGTDDSEQITFTALDDSAVSFTKKWTYDALAKSWATINDMPPANLAAWLNAERVQMGAALANQLDADILGLHASATTSVGSNAVDVSLPLLVEAIKALRVANAPEPYFMVFDETQWDHLAQIDELTRFDVRGEGDTIVNRQAFRLHGVSIFTTNNVVAASSAANNIAFSGEAFAIAIRDMVKMVEWQDPDLFSTKLAAYSDYAYANTFADYFVRIQTTDA